MANVRPIPEGYHSVTPYLVARDAPRLIDFLEQAFGAKLIERHDRPDGSIMHAEVRIGDSHVMLGEACGEMGPTSSCQYLYVEDADGVYQRAVAAGAMSLMEPVDHFWGDRMGGVTDPAGNIWWISTHVEDVSEEEIARRAEAFAGQGGEQG